MLARTALVLVGLSTFAVACKRSEAPSAASTAPSTAVTVEGRPESAQTTRANAMMGGMPAGLGTPLPLSAEVTTRRTRGSTVVTLKKTITRGSDRVHVLQAPLRAEEAASEWWLVQNPSDPRRVTGTLVEHGLRALVVYQEHELASAGVSRNWADVAALGLKVADAFEALATTGKRERAFGFEFTQRAAPAGQAGIFRELWWSDQAAVPLRWVEEDERGRTEVSAVLSTNLDASVLKDPKERFPSYEVTDLATLETRPRPVEADGRATP